MSSGKKGAAPGPATAEEAQALIQVLQAQSNMQGLLLSAYSLSFQQCTSTSTYEALSAKERRCIQQGVATYIEARSHVATHLAARSQAAGKDF